MKEANDQQELDKVGSIIVLPFGRRQHDASLSPFVVLGTKCRDFTYSQPEKILDEEIFP